MHNYACGTPSLALAALHRAWISNPSVGCSSHPGRAASLWGTIEKNAALVGRRLCFVNNSQRCSCSCRRIARANDRLSPSSNRDHRRHFHPQRAKRIPRKRLWRTSALSTNISKRRSKRRRILSGLLRRRACLPASLTSCALAMARRCRSTRG